MQCESAAAAVASLVAGEVPSSRSQAQHVDQCLRCQAEVVRGRRVRRSLRELRTAMVSPDPALLSDLLLAVSRAAADEAQRSKGRARRLVYLAAAATAAGGAAGGIAVAALRRRPGRHLIAAG